MNYIYDYFIVSVGIVFRAFLMDLHLYERHKGIKVRHNTSAFTGCPTA